MRRSTLVLGGAGVLLAGAYGFLALAPRTVPAGQPALLRLERGRIEALRTRFNAARDSARLLVLLSPS